MEYSKIINNNQLSKIRKLYPTGKQEKKIYENQYKNNDKYINLEKTNSPNNKIIKVRLKKRPNNNNLSSNNHLSTNYSIQSDIKKTKQRFSSSDNISYNITNENINNNYSYNSNNSLLFESHSTCSIVRKNLASSMESANSIIRKKLFKDENNIRQLLLSPKIKQNNIFIRKQSLNSSVTKSIDFEEDNIINMNKTCKNNSNNSIIKLIYKREQSNNELYGIKIEDIFILNERLKDIINKIINNNNENIISEDGESNVCFEYLLFYFNCSFVEKIQNFFSNKNKIISLSSNNLNLLSIVLTYTISIDINLLLDYKILLTNIYPLIKENFLLEIRQILNYLKMNNIEFPNLKYLFLIKKILSKNNIEEFSEQYIINQLTKNSKTIVEYVKIIVNQMYKENYPNSKELLTIFYNISKIDNYCINNFYLNKVLKISNQNKSMINSNNNIKQYLNLTMKIPYINTPSLKKFSLVIDLDETLISLKLNNKNKGILKFRPYLFDFLNNLKPYYELISFTYGTKNYAEPIINEIESKKKYFDIKLFREHSIIIGKDFVKDISRIGRPMSKIVIVDNININYRLNQENGILIYPFYEDNFKFDKALLELKNILLEIYKKYDDIREGLLDFKDEIITKVSCNLDYL